MNMRSALLPVGLSLFSCSQAPEATSEPSEELVQPSEVVSQEAAPATEVIAQDAADPSEPATKAVISLGDIAPKEVASKALPEVRYYLLAET